MKNGILTLLLLLIAASGNAQSNVGIGTITPDPSAKMDVTSTTQGLLPPRMTAAQRSAINSPATGLMVFQTDGNPGMYYYNGTNWQSLTDGTPVNNAGFPPNYAVVTSFAGSFTAGSNNATGTFASFDHPSGLAVDAAGNVYVADHNGHRIRKITPAAVVTTLAGGGGAGSNGSGSTDATGTAASFNFPNGVAVDLSGNVYVADYGNNKIRMITPNGVVTTLAGSATNASGSADGTGALASFYNPSSVAVDASGNVYVADFNNNKIRKITAGGVVTTFAGSATNALGSADGMGTAASFNQPCSIAVDASGNVYVADEHNHKIRKITAGGVVTTLAGSAANASGSADGTGSTASFYYPSGVTVDASGNVYVCDQFNHKIRMITAAGVVTTLAGLPGNITGTADGTGAAAGFNYPYGVVVDAAGNVYVGDTNSNKIRKITTR